VLIGGSGSDQKLTGEALVCFSSEESASSAVQQQQNNPNFCREKGATGFMSGDGSAAVTFSLACRMVYLLFRTSYVHARVRLQIEGSYAL